MGAFNHVAEESLLGAMLLATQAVDESRQGLEVTDFFVPAHRLIYQAVLTVRDEGGKPDPVTVGGVLDRRGDLEKAGGLGGLLALQASAPTISNAPRYAQMLKELADVRNMAEAGRYITSLAESGEGGEEGRGKAEEALYAALHRRVTGGSRLEHASEVIGATLEHLEELENGQKEHYGVYSGIKALDEVTKGLQPKTLSIFAGRPGQGKSALALTCADHCSIRLQRPVLYRSAEVGRVESGLRMLASEARVNGTNLKVADLSAEDWERVTRAAHKFVDSKLWMDFGPLNVAAIIAQAKMIKAREGDLGLVIVDQLQCYPGNSARNKTKAEHVGSLVQLHKEMANELDTAVILLAQINREGGGRRPVMEDLKDSGGIEEYADLALGIWREDISTIEAKLVVMKHRSGEAGMDLDVAFLGKYTRFTDITKA